MIISIVDVAADATGIASGNVFLSDSNILEIGWPPYITSSAGTYSAQWIQNKSGTYSSSTVSFKAAGTTSPCDLNADGLVDIQDVQDATIEAMGLSNAPACQAPQVFCTMAYVQAVLTNAMGGGCILPVIGGPNGVNFGNVNVGGSSTQTVSALGRRPFRHDDYPGKHFRHRVQHKRTNAAADHTRRGKTLSSA